MANKNIFTPVGRVLPQVDTVNEAGGDAFKLSDKAALAQYALTGTISNTFYASAETELDKILELSGKVSSNYIGKLAIYAREKGLMKDTPALLCAILAEKDVEILKKVFSKVINNGKMLRNFIQIVRSGKVGRKSFGTAVKKLVQKWFDARSDVALFRDSVGNDPSIADVIKMVHPCPNNKEREALYGYLIGKKVVKKSKDMEVVNGRKNTVLLETLPSIVQDFETFKEAVLSGKATGTPPDVEFRLLTALNLGEKQWKEIAKNAPWQMTRMNLNTFARHGVFNDSNMVDLIANRLKDEKEIAKARVFPYQLLCAFKSTENVPTRLTNALQDALEVATKNVPAFTAKEIAVLVDTSGSMGSAVTGNRGSATTAVRCVDVAGLMAACVLRNNQNSEIVLFDTSVYRVNLNPRDSVMTNAQKCARGGGGTDISCGLRDLNQRHKSPDLVIIVSDNESWAQVGSGRRRGTTDCMVEWEQIRKRNKNAKMVCIDLTPMASTQLKDDKNILNIGGFSDSIWEIISAFCNNELNGEHFVEQIEKIQLNDSNTEVVNSAVKGAKKAIRRK